MLLLQLGKKAAEFFFVSGEAQWQGVFFYNGFISNVDIWQSYAPLHK